MQGRLLRSLTYIGFPYRAYITCVLYIYIEAKHFSLREHILHMFVRTSARSEPYFLGFPVILDESQTHYQRKTTIPTQPDRECR